MGQNTLHVNREHGFSRHLFQTFISTLHTRPLEKVVSIWIKYSVTHFQVNKWLNSVYCSKFWGYVWLNVLCPHSWWLPGMKWPSCLFKKMILRVSQTDHTHARTGTGSTQSEVRPITSEDISSWPSTTNQQQWEVPIIKSGGSNPYVSV